MPKEQTFWEKPVAVGGIKFYSRKKPAKTREPMPVPPVPRHDF